VSILRSVGAVLAGAATGIALEIGADMALRAAGIFPPLGEKMSDGLFVLATAHRAVFGVLGAYVTARLAEDRPMAHALILGGLGLMATVAGAVETWDKGPEFGPKWYPLMLVVLAMPQAWLGGRLRESQAGVAASAQSKAAGSGT
jgi:hypothetical protein